MAAFLFILVFAPVIGSLPLSLPMALSFGGIKDQLTGPNAETWGTYLRALLAAIYRIGALPALIASIPVCLIVWRRGTIGVLPVVVIAPGACMTAAVAAIPALQIPAGLAFSVAALLSIPAVLTALLVRWLAICIAVPLLRHLEP